VEFRCLPAIRAVKFFVPQVRSGCGCYSLVEDFTGLGQEATFLVSPAEFSNMVLLVLGFIFGIRSIQSSGFFQGTCLSTGVTSFFRSSSFQPRPRRLSTLGAWPAHAKEVTLWPSTYGPRLVSQGAVGGFLVVPRSSGGFLMQRRSSAAARGLHMPLLMTAVPDACPVLVFCLGCFFIVFFSFHGLLV